MNDIKLIREYVKYFLCEKDNLSGSDPSESYTQNITSDKAYKKRSFIVPEKDKDEINDWLVDMGLS